MYILKKNWLRITVYTILLVLAINTGILIISNRNFYGINLYELRRVGDYSTKEISELSKTVVKICDNLGSGSGTIIHADKLFIYILTNNHVACKLDSSSAYVKFIGSSTDICVKNVIPIAYEESTDLAIIVIPRATENFKIAELATEIPKTGDEILTIGFPIGLTHFCSRGTYTGVKSKREFYSDLAIAPGASGSPVFNKDGKLVGVVKAISLSQLPRNKYWRGCGQEDAMLYLVRNSICVNLYAITKFLGNLTK